MYSGCTLDVLHDRLWVKVVHGSGTQGTCSSFPLFSPRPPSVGDDRMTSCDMPVMTFSERRGSAGVKLRIQG